MARLPQPGKDSGVWGNVLNDFLAQSHKADGTLRDGSVGVAQLADNAVTAATIQNDVVSEDNLTPAVRSKLNTSTVTWDTLPSKPAFIAAGDGASTARDAIAAAPSLAHYVVDQYGADPTGAIDATIAIQNAINDARDAVRAGYHNSGLVIIQQGTYRIGSRIIQPPYVKVITQGSVVIESYVENDSCWQLSPLSDDPDPLYMELRKQQWNAGPPIDGSSGGLTFVNKVGATDGTTGLELGSRADYGAARPLCRYKLTDIAIQGYEIGLQWNCYRHYIANYERFHIERCSKAVYIGSGEGEGVDSGENITWSNSVFASPVMGVGDDWVLGVSNEALFTWDYTAIDMNFLACSFDFATTVFRFIYGYQQVNVFGGHIEGINIGAWETPTGGIAVSEVVSNPYPEVRLFGVPFTPGETRGTLFRGNLNLDLGMTHRGSIEVNPADLEYGRAYLCDPSVRVLNNSYRLRGTGPSIARQCNTLRDPVFTDDTVGTYGDALSHWDNDVTGGTRTHVVDADSPVAGGRSLAISMTGSVYTRYTTKAYQSCRPGDRIYAKYAYKFSAATPDPVMTIAMAWYDSEKNQIGSTTEANLYRSHTLSNEWSVPDDHVVTTAPAGACFYKIGFQISCPNGDGIVQYKISDFHAYIGS